NPALHDPNYQNYDPNAQSANNPTTQLNTRRSDQYLEPGDQNRPPGWIQIGDPNTPAAHMPAGGRNRGPTGPGESPGVPAGTPTPQVPPPGRNGSGGGDDGGAPPGGGGGGGPIGPVGSGHGPIGGGGPPPLPAGGAGPAGPGSSGPIAFNA